MPLGTEVGLGSGNIVLDGNPASRHKKGHSTDSSLPHIWAHVYCGQKAAKRSPISSTAELLYVIFTAWFYASLVHAVSLFSSVCPSMHYKLVLYQNS